MYNSTPRVDPTVLAFSTPQCPPHNLSSDTPNKHDGRPATRIFLFSSFFFTLFSKFYTVPLSTLVIAHSSPSDALAGTAFSAQHVHVAAHISARVACPPPSPPCAACVWACVSCSGCKLEPSRPTAPAVGTQRIARLNHALN